MKFKYQVVKKLERYYVEWKFAGLMGWFFDDWVRSGRSYETQEEAVDAIDAELKEEARIKAIEEAKEEVVWP
jgi:hypothetical protein